MKRLVEQIAKFGVVGAVAFAIDYGVMLFLVEACGVGYLPATTAGFVVSVVFNYLASMKWVFARKQDMNRTAEFAVFVALSVVGLGLNDLLMWIGVDMLGADYRIVKFGATFAVMVYNFITRKVFLEAKPGR